LINPANYLERAKKNLAVYRILAMQVSLLRRFILQRFDLYGIFIHFIQFAGNNSWRLMARACSEILEAWRRAVVSIDTNYL
jgi:hypothetical protein